MQSSPRWEEANGDALTSSNVPAKELHQKVGLRHKNES